MSWYKDQWNERYYERFEKLNERGITGRDAEDLAAKHADGLSEDLMDQADNLRKAKRENG